MRNKYDYKEYAILIDDMQTNLQDYQGYIQFSNRPIDREKDIFDNGKKVEAYDDGKNGFIYEAHFYKDGRSITIRQINDAWHVDQEKNIDMNEIQTYHGIDGLKVNMAQIWHVEKDELCDFMEVKKLNKVVFAGFGNLQPTITVQKKKEPNSIHERRTYENLSEEQRKKLLTHFLGIFKTPYVNSILETQGCES